ncbi:MAG: hypothetical protein DBW94_02930 [Gammaproteobacteria bacterium]|nr:MAG: hypothetical protein DBW94_02930 [Gammaproteobacteria bacterium]
MLNRLIHHAKRVLPIILLMVAFLWFSGEFIMRSLPQNISQNLEINIIDPIKNITTSCSSLEEEIKKDQECRWSLSCRLSRNEQVAYEERKINFEKFCTTE